MLRGLYQMAGGEARERGKAQPGVPNRGMGWRGFCRAFLCPLRNVCWRGTIVSKPGRSGVVVQASRLRRAAALWCRRLACDVQPRRPHHNRSSLGAAGTIPVVNQAPIRHQMFASGAAKKCHRTGSCCFDRHLPSSPHMTMVEDHNNQRDGTASPPPRSHRHSQSASSLANPSQSSHYGCPGQAAPRRTTHLYE
jgi:hypothetical protein